MAQRSLFGVERKVVDGSGSGSEPEVEAGIGVWLQSSWVGSQGGARAGPV